MQLPCRSTCRNVWLTAGRSALHVGVRSALADITLIAFSFARAGQCFFHEYGRRVGMVRRSSLKERKNNQMVEKRTKTTQQQTKQTEQSPQAESPPSCSLSSVLR